MKYNYSDILRLRPPAPAGGVRGQDAGAVNSYKGKMKYDLNGYDSVVPECIVGTLNVLIAGDSQYRVHCRGEVFSPCLG
jgi:hypothetical protein